MPLASHDMAMVESATAHAAAEDLAAWTSTLALEDIPADVRAASVEHALDALGCGLAALGVGEATAGLDVARDAGGTGPSSVIGLAGGASPAEALRMTADEIAATTPFTSLNCLLLTPDELYAFCRFDPDGDLEDKDPEYYNLRYRTSGDAVVVSSSGWGRGWQELGNGDLLAVRRRTLETHVLAGAELGMPS